MSNIDLNALGPVLRLFIERIATTPRPPSGEDRMLAIVEEAAAVKGCSVGRDAGRNLYIRVPAAGRGGDALGLQAHADMVCERAPNAPYDPRRDPIPVELYEEHGVTLLRAQGCNSTLGADNGIGLAMLMAILEDTSLVHPPLDLLITVEEEIGLKGAQWLDPVLITANRLINLDTEDEGLQTVATAGACSSTFRRQVVLDAAPRNAECWRIGLTDVRGGHSGLHIHRRASALAVLVRLLQEASARHEFLIHQMHAGTASNVIPTSALAEILMPPDAASSFVESIVRHAQELLLQIDEVQAKVTCEKLTLTASDAWNASYVLEFLTALPYGALQFSDRFSRPLVEVSNNVWKVEVADQLVVSCSSRAMTDRGLDEILSQLRGIATTFEAEFTELPGRFPAWEPQESRLQQVAASVYRDLFGRLPKTAAFHAGIELSVIKRRFQDAGRALDATSIGPTIHGPHTLNECVDVASVDRTWSWPCQILARID